MFDKQTIKTALSEQGLGEQELLQSIKKKEAAGKKVLRAPMRRLMILAAGIAVFLLLCSFIPAMRRLLNIYYTPDEELMFIEIYTAEDLDAVRNDMGANYRLMNDIVFTDADYAEGGRFEGGFVPIGGMWYDEGNARGGRSFSGIFDGNGYTIYNLQINTQDTLYAGLFGYCEGMGIDGLASVGLITNLRLCGGRVIAEDAEIVGGIVGFGSYVIRCSVEDMEVVGGEGTKKESVGGVAVGGIAGCADLIDSCYVDATVSGGDYCGQIAGRATTIVTSVGASSQALCGSYRLLPSILSEKVFDELITAADETYLYNLLRAFYFRYDEEYLGWGGKTLEGTLELFSNNLEYLDAEVDDAFYVARFLTMRDIERIESWLEQAVGREQCEAVLNEAGYKLGELYSYHITEGETYEGFDFDEIWTMKDGKPVLRVFADK